MKYRLLILLLVPVIAFAQYRVHINSVKYPVQPTMWGLFFEDINRGADGGLYAELVKNRSFDFPDPYMGWALEPARRLYARHEVFQVINQSATHDRNPKYLQVTINTPEKITIANEGFGGITVKNGMDYELTIRYRIQKPGLKIKANIINASGKTVGGTLLEFKGNGWQTLGAKIQSSDTTVNGKLLLSFEGTGKMDLDRISLFPADATKKLRSDLVQKLAAIKPGFLRFPGGCIVEGKNTDNRYQWKFTIGPPEERKLIANQWQDGAAGPKLPDYFQSFGLGFYEYFLLCEDLKTEPMPILNCGISCQFDAAEVIPMGQMDPYVKDALDLIEFANGDARTKWGKVRVALGHPTPFNMKLLGIGNENWGPQYIERLELFTKAIKSKYPEIQLITSTGYSPNPQFRYMDSVLRKMKVDIIDEHYYQTVNWFLMNAGKYDNYDRKGPKIFLGEYACHSVRIGSPDNKNTQLCALAEAAFMTGLERNADIVTMAAYAPLFAHVKDWQWTPNLIWFDNAKSYATPSYWVQQMFSVNKGTHVIGINAQQGQDSIWASAVIDKNKNELIVKLVNPSGTEKLKTIEIPDLKGNSAGAMMTVLKSETAGDVNSLEKEAMVPVESPVEVKDKKIDLKLEPYSFTVLRMRY